VVVHDMIQVDDKHFIDMWLMIKSLITIQANTMHCGPADTPDTM